MCFLHSEVVLAAVRRENVTGEVVRESSVPYHFTGAADKELASVRCASCLQNVPVRGSKVSVGVGKRENRHQPVNEILAIDLNRDIRHDIRAGIIVSKLPHHAKVRTLNLDIVHQPTWKVLSGNITEEKQHCQRVQNQDYYRGYT
ncbi:hypothetical protein TNCV_4955161 [Trichonephila clavipes]|nr:hypothetical protein TNCV_4955161 [Trichonephila clavipes]